MKFEVGKVILHSFVKCDHGIVHAKYFEHWSSFSTASMMLNFDPNRPIKNFNGIGYLLTI